MTVFIATGIACALAGSLTYGLVQRLPSFAFDAASGKFAAARERSLRVAPGAAREGRLFWAIGLDFRRALRDEAKLPNLESAAGRAASGIIDSQLIRLQQAGVRMRTLERAQRPREIWWPVLKPYLDGLDNARFSHFENELIAAWAAAYESAGLGPGTAYDVARHHVGNPHGQFLQYFCKRMNEVADEREAAGDSAAAVQCRSIVRRLLRQWVLDAGPAPIRLLAADLLVDALEQESGELAADLQQWRAAYRESARSRPATLLAIAREPAAQPETHEALVGWMALTSWTAAAVLTVGVAALLMAWRWLTVGGAVERVRTAVLAGLIVAVVVVAVGVLWVRIQPETFRADFRADWSALRYAWRHPFYAGGLAVFGVLAAACSARRVAGRRRRATRFGATAV